MDDAERYGNTISLDEKKQMFYDYMKYLVENSYEFSIKQFNGMGFSLVCEKLGVTLDLALDKSLLMALTPEHSFIVNDLDYLIKETVEKYKTKSSYR